MSSCCLILPSDALPRYPSPMILHEIARRSIRSRKRRKKKKEKKKKRKEEEDSDANSLVSEQESWLALRSNNFDLVHFR